MTENTASMSGWPYQRAAGNDLNVGSALQAVIPMPRALPAALAKAQGAFEQIRRDKTVTVTMKAGGRYTFAYAPLESILRAVSGALAANELSLSQRVVENAKGQQCVETILLHSSGESLSNQTQIFINGDGAQAYGSALTYARRYGVTLLLCVSADDDDDGNAAEGNDAQVVREAQPRNDPRVKEYVDRLNAAFEVGIDGPVLSIVDELSTDQELKIAVWGKLPSGMRSQIKTKIEQAK